MPATEKRGGSGKAFRKYWRVVFYPLGMFPAIWLLWQGQNGQLGADPINAFERALGLWAFRFLIVCLMLAPLRWLTGLNFLRYRRLTGLLAFFYAALHVLTYVGLDHRFDWRVLWRDITHRPFVILGMLAFVMLLPLALTSNLVSLRKLGRGWKKLHLAIFPAAALAGVHFFLAFKTLNALSAFYLSVMAVVLVLRLPKWFGRRRSAAITR